MVTHLILLQLRIYGENRSIFVSGKTLIIFCLTAPKVERHDDNSCEVTWEALAPMKGDPVIYTLQCMMGNSEFKQVLF